MKTHNSEKQIERKADYIDPGRTGTRHGCSVPIRFTFGSDLMSSLGKTLSSAISIFVNMQPVPQDRNDGGARQAEIGQ